MPKWSKISDHPAVYLILGDIRQRKTTTAASIIDEFHTDKKLPVYMIAPKKVVDAWPKWFHQVDPAKPKLPQKCIVFVDDAHLFYYAREWRGGGAKFLDFVARQRAHDNRTLIYTTQQSRVLDINLITMSSAIVFKKPSKLQIESERKLVRDMFKKAKEELKTKDFKPEWAYVVADSPQGEFEGLVEVKTPEWFTHKMSKANKAMSRADEKPVNPKKYVKPILRIIKQIGRLAQ
jgi:hypothetical protein